MAARIDTREQRLASKPYDNSVIGSDGSKGGDGVGGACGEGGPGGCAEPRLEVRRDGCAHASVLRGT